MNAAAKSPFPTMLIAICAVALTGCVESNLPLPSEPGSEDPTGAAGEPGESAVACTADLPCDDELSAHAPRVWFQAVGEQDHDCTDGICRSVLVNHGDHLKLWLHDRVRIVAAVELELTDFGYERLERIEARLGAEIDSLPLSEEQPDDWNHMLRVRVDNLHAGNAWFTDMNAPEPMQSLAWFAVSMMQQARACSNSPMFDIVGGSHCAPEMP